MSITTPSGGNLFTRRGETASARKSEIVLMTRDVRCAAG
jgi:hypothetical protein